MTSFSELINGQRMRERVRSTGRLVALSDSEYLQGWALLFWGLAILMQDNGGITSPAFREAIESFGGLWAWGTIPLALFGLQISGWLHTRVGGSPRHGLRVVVLCASAGYFAGLALLLSSAGSLWAGGGIQLFFAWASFRSVQRVWEYNGPRLWNVGD